MPLTRSTVPTKSVIEVSSRAGNSTKIGYQCVQLVKLAGKQPRGSLRQALALPAARRRLRSASDRSAAGPPAVEILE